MDYDILIAEDEPFFARLCAKTLAGPGRWVRVATDGKQAIEEIERRKPDVLLLDLMLPEVDGFSIIAHLKSRGAGFPVIILSNLGDENEPDLAGHLGVAAYCVKSATPLAELQAMVERILGIPATVTMS